MENLTHIVKLSTIVVLKLWQFWVFLIRERYSLNVEFLHTNLGLEQVDTWDCLELQEFVWTVHLKRLKMKYIFNCPWNAPIRKLLFENTCRALVCYLMVLHFLINVWLLNFENKNILCIVCQVLSSWVIGIFIYLDIFLLQDFL